MSVVLPEAVPVEMPSELGRSGPAPEDEPVAPPPPLRFPTRAVDGRRPRTHVALPRWWVPAVLLSSAAPLAIRLAAWSLGVTPPDASSSAWSAAARGMLGWTTAWAALAVGVVSFAQHRLSRDGRTLALGSLVAAVGALAALQAFRADVLVREGAMALVAPAAVTGHVLGLALLGACAALFSVSTTRATTWPAAAPWLAAVPLGAGMALAGPWSPAWLAPLVTVAACAAATVGAWLLARHHPTHAAKALLLACAPLSVSALLAVAARSPLDADDLLAQATGIAAWLVVLAGASLDAALAQRARVSREAEASFRAFGQTASDAIVTVDELGTVTFANDAAAGMFGHPAEALVGGSASAVVPAWLREPWLAALQRHVAAGAAGSSWGPLEVPGLHASGRAIPLEVSLGELPAAGGRAFFAIARDVTRRKESERALRESEERHALAVRGANDGIWDWDLVKGSVFYSARWLQMLGIDEDAAGTPDTWMSRVHPDDLGRLRAALDAHLEGRTSHFEFEHRVRHRDGSWRWVLCRGLAVWDPRGRPLRIAGSQTDVTTRRNAQEQLLHEVLHDALTKLPNRTFFLDRLRQAMARARRRRNQGFAVLYLDLDRFKIVNDSLGHGAGDQLLVAFSRRLETCLRPGDSAARLGGDEFAVLLDEISGREEADRVASRIQDALRASFELGEHEAFTSASIGIAVYDPRCARAEDMLRDADTAMYLAKKRGKARHEHYEPGMHVQAVNQLQLETDLRRALDREEFHLLYQPIVDLATGRLAGLEALVRWTHPERGLVMPGDFIGIAEETGLVLPLGAWVLGEACREMRRWRDGGAEGIFVSVNLSSRQFTRSELYEIVAAALATTGLPADALMLEVTEHMLMEDPKRAGRVLESLRTLGVHLAVDDFGTGYSSLSYLHSFPIDLFKIDQSFVQRMGPDGVEADLVATIVGLAKSLRMRVIAEGVETAEQSRRLAELACTYGQGDWYSRPLSKEDAAALIREGRRWG